MRKMYSRSFLIGREWFTIDQVGKKEYRVSVRQYRIVLYRINSIDEVYDWCISYYNRSVFPLATVG